jgi:hypothetical protein
MPHYSYGQSSYVLIILADIGLQTYTENLCGFAGRIGRIFRGGLIVLLGLIFPPGRVGDLVLVQSIADALAWSSKMAKVSIEGEPILKQCFERLVELLKSSGSGSEQTAIGARFRLPSSLFSPQQQKWDTSGLTGLMSGVEPLDPKEIIRIVNLLFKELSYNLGWPKLEMAGFYGANPVAPFSKKIILVGASHMHRIEEALKETGISTEWVITKN